MAQNSVSTTKYETYDEYGQVLTQRQSTGAVTPFDFTYTYTVAGGLKSEQDPSQRRVVYDYDLNGQISKVTNGTTSVDYATATYAPNGVLSGLAMHNGINEQIQFNERFQPTTIQAGSVPTLGYGYGTSNNNGNVRSATVAFPNGGGTASISQSFLYDDLNRLRLAAENPSNPTLPGCPDAASSWCEQYSYDRYGNRLIAQRSHVGVGIEPGSFNILNQNADAGWTYAAGNLTADTGGGTYAYDLEGHMTSAGANVYQYDAEGRRVQKVTSEGTWMYAYQADGMLASESDRITSQTNCTTCYLTADALGSTRLITDQNGTAVERDDYFPFGDQILSSGGSNPRAGVTAYATDVRLAQKFTGKERDSETGLDFFGARYFSSAQGRFSSTDPKQFSSRTLMNPQKWNKYGYTLNNPLTLVDLDGKEEVTLQFRAFIPPGSIAGFRGDNRSFSSDPNASSRVSTTVRIETDPAKNGGNPLLGTAQTVVGKTHPKQEAKRRPMGR